MSDQEEGTARPETGYPNQPKRLFHMETGEGSLLERAVEFTNDFRQPSLVPIQLEGGETAYVQAAPNASTFVALEPAALDAYRAAPVHMKGDAELLDLDSLIQHIERLKKDDTLVLADNDRTNPAIVAIYDYRNRDVKSFGRHKATFKAPLSDEWLAWTAKDATALEMPEFARFLEDHIVDVIPPTGTELSDEQSRFVSTLGGKGRIADAAKLMELATGLQVFEEGQVSQASKLQSGESQITIESRHVDGQGGQLIIPSMFVIGIPVFRNGPAYQILVRLRYRKVAGIIFFYELWRTDRVFDHAFTEAIERVRDETGLPVLLGKAK